MDAERCAILMVTQRVIIWGKFSKSKSKTEVEARVKRFKNGKAAGKDEVTGEILKSKSELLIHWV